MIRKKFSLIPLLLLFVLSSAAKETIPYNGFVYVKNLIPDLIEDLRYAGNNNFMGEPATGYQANRVILSRQAATALKAAADEFRKLGYVIKIYDAYRPQSAVDHFVRWSKTSDQLYRLQVGTQQGEHHRHDHLL